MEITRKFVEENNRKRFNITFNNGEVMNKVGFFIGGLTNTPCYMNSRQKRRGYLVPWNWNDGIKSIEEVQKVTYTNEGNAKKLLKRLHENSWDNLKESWGKIAKGGEIDNDFKWHFTGKLKFRSMTSLLNRIEQERLKEAFESKKEFRWHRYAMGKQGRDLSISTRMCDDGIFRAWFSSEFPGCGNGDYYLLLSPTTAVYYERD